MDRPRLTVADVFRRYGDGYRAQAAATLSTAQRRVMTAIERCRTAALVGHVEQCDQFWTVILVPDASRGFGFWLTTVDRSRSDGRSAFTGMTLCRRVKSEAQSGKLAALGLITSMPER